MFRVRSVLSVVIAAIAIFIVSCSSPPQAATGPLYSDLQIERIQSYTADLQILRDRITEIPSLVTRRQWTDVQNLIHGPLGELRVKMVSITRNLEADLQDEARSMARDVFDHLVDIDQAAVAQDTNKALANYNNTLEDFDRFLQLLPDFSGPGAVDAA
ncbi:MAG: photosystem II protein PsbQ [Synechococcales bacterium]|nr:photosystem II protein PsbQ [Synechococcales bacterium]